MANDPEKAAYYEGKIDDFFNATPMLTASFAAKGLVYEPGGVVVHEDGSVTYIGGGSDSLERVREVNEINKAKREKEAAQRKESMERSREAAEVRRQLMEIAYKKQSIAEALAKLQFLHNGRPFRTKDILSIVNQVSSKDPDEAIEKIIQMRTAAELRFSKEENAGCTVEVAYPDAEGSPQPGFDIRVTVSEGDTEQVYYFEVKTHTTSSIVKNVLYISNEQMPLAATKKEAYYVLNVRYDYRNMQGEKMEVYPDPVARIAEGKLKNTESKYIFRIA